MITLSELKEEVGNRSDSVSRELSKEISFLYIDTDMTRNAGRLASYKDPSASVVIDAINSFIIPSESSWMSWPSFRWHGSNNQYHKWLSGILIGDFGHSIVDNKPILQKIISALKWTLLLTIMGLLLSFPLGIIIGFFLAHYQGTRKARWLDRLLFTLYATPLFWLATLFIVFFTTPEYGSWTDIFASPLFKVRSDYGWFQTLLINSTQLILPVICLTIHSLAIVGKLVKESILTEMKKPYVIHLKSKGLDKRSIYFRHILKNIGVPLVTMVSNSVPRLLAGSLLIEVIFNIPGMGRLMYTSIFSADWEVVYLVLLFSVIVTSITYFIADMLYGWLDQRIDAI